MPRCCTSGSIIAVVGSCLSATLAVTGRHVGLSAMTVAVVVVTDGVGKRPASAK